LLSSSRSSWISPASDGRTRLGKGRSADPS
jgi:hypothetical protein